MSYPILDKSLIYNILYSRFKGEFLTLKDLPHPNYFKDMQLGVNRVVRAIRAKEKIALIGDYDVDGVVATTIIKELFREINYPIEWIIPNRFSDGYGISKSVIDRVEADLIITVDNGIAAIEAANLCKERNIDLIITDHHTVGDKLPVAYATINQKQSDCSFPYKEICGAQIAWYFATAIARELGVKLNSKKLLGITALAIVADIMPLTDINRAMLIAGLQVLNKEDFAFIKALKEQGFKNIDSQSIAYYIAPLLNSAGRLEDASIVSEFLFTKDVEVAKSILQQLVELNNLRKDIEQNITKEAFKQVDKDDAIAVVWGHNWNEGVVGIVASRVSEHFKIPAIVLSCKDGICKGSGRSYANCDLYSLVATAKGYFLKFGGHKSAIGLSLEQDRVPIVKSLLNLEAKKLCKGSSDFDSSILGILPFSQIDLELVDLLSKFEPYGEANPRPKFITKNVEVLEIYEVGKNKEHKRYRLRDKNRVFSAIEFRSKSQIEIGDIVEIIYTVDKNEYNGNLYINLYIEAIKKEG